MPLCFALFVVALSFGVVAVPVVGAAASIAMSVLLFAGSAQFAAVTVLGVGGDALSAIVAGMLMNARFIPMSLAVTPHLPPGLLRRVLMTLSITDVTWAMSIKPDGGFDPYRMLGAAIPQYLTWQVGTVAGVLLSGTLNDTERLGIDAMFPAFFLALLLGGEQRRDAWGVGIAAVAGLIALLLIPVTPPGVPLILASLAALLILLRPGA